MGVVREGVGFLSQIITATIVPPLAEGTETVMKKVEERLLRMEKRILRKTTSLFFIGVGGAFLAFALFFSLKEILGWSDAAACFSIGITIFVIGLLLKAGESDG